MDKGIKFVVDSAADIPKDLVEKYDIGVVNCPVFFEDEEFSGNNQEFYQKIATSTDLPRTAQPSPFEIEEFLTKFQEYDCIIFVTLSSAGSGLYDAAKVVVNGLLAKVKCDIVVIDSKTYSMAIGKYVLKAAQMRDLGASKEEIINYLTDCYSRVNIYFMINDLKHLKAGGRIKATQAVLASVLDIKPICTLEDGLVKFCCKEHGYRKAIAKLLSLVDRGGGCEDLAIIHSSDDERLEQFVNLVTEKFNLSNVEVYEVGPAIAAHAGLGVLGVIFSENVFG